MVDDIQVEGTNRHVIADRLLMELADVERVAVSLNKEDLDKFIGLLEGRRDEWSQNMLAGFKVLRERAFNG